LNICVLDNYMFNHTFVYPITVCHISYWCIHSSHRRLPHVTLELILEQMNAIIVMGTTAVRSLLDTSNLGDLCMEQVFRDTIAIQPFHADTRGTNQSIKTACASRSSSRQNTNADGPSTSTDRKAAASLLLFLLLFFVKIISRSLFQALFFHSLKPEKKTNICNLELLLLPCAIANRSYILCSVCNAASQKNRIPASHTAQILWLLQAQRNSLLLFSLAQLLLRRVLDNECVQLVTHIHI